MTGAPTEPIAKLETELKLFALEGIDASKLMAAARDAGFVCEPAHVHHQRDRYLDTADLGLASAGLGLRVRVRNGSTELGLKLRAQPRGKGARAALWRRVELEVPLADGAALPSDASMLPESMRHRVAPFALARPLREIVALETERTVIPIRHADATSIELTLDRVVLIGASTVSPFSEVEAELLAGEESALERLSRSLIEIGLVPSTEDKLARSLACLGLDVPGPPATRLSADLTLREAASRVLRVHLKALRRAEPEARIGEDLEGVHRMRVATRRLRAALRLVREGLPARAAESQRRFLRRTATLLGDVRDLDVLLESLPALVSEAPGALRADSVGIEALLRELRMRARARLLAWLDSPARFAGEEKLERFVNDPGAGRAGRGPAARPIGEVARALLAREAVRVFRCGDRLGKESPTERLHALRLAVKRLRYTAEALLEVLGPELEDTLRRIVGLQDALGRLNDASVACEILVTRTTGREGRALPRRCVLTAGALAAVCEMRAAQARRDARDAWKRFAKGKVRRALEIDTPATDPTAPADDADVRDPD